MTARPGVLPELINQVVSESLAERSDRALLEQFIDRNDESAFAAIVDRHGPMLLAQCRRLLNDAHLADDVLQATFLVLARKAQSIRSRDSLASWLYGVAPRAFTPDGQSLIVQREIVSVRDIETGKQRISWSLRRNRVLEKREAGAGRGRGGESDRIDAVAVSPDGNRIAFAVAKNGPPGFGTRAGTGLTRLMVLETRTKKLLHQVDIENDNIRDLAFSPDGKLLAAGGMWTVRVWEVGTEKATGQFEGQRGRMTSLAFSPDGKRLASASEDSTVLIWKLKR